MLQKGWLLLKVRAQTVLFENSEESVARFLTSLANSAGLETIELSLASGDCSEKPCLSESFVLKWQQKLLQKRIAWSHVFFHENLGFGQAHNRLAGLDKQNDRLFLANPDCLVGPWTVQKMNQFADGADRWGMVEARQIPLEHPKAFNRETLQTSWCSGACVLIPTAIFQQAGGFDADLFMYAEDVDLSWKVRGLGLSCFYCPSAFVYHAKRLGPSGIQPGAAEEYHGTLSSLILIWKYGYRATANRLLQRIGRSTSENAKRAASRFAEIRDQLSPAPITARKAAEIGDDCSFGGRRWEYASPGQGFHAES